MKSFARMLLLLGLLSTLVFAQEKNIRFSDIVKAFNGFNYRQVIQQSAKLLQKKDQLSAEQAIELLRMKAIAHYTLGQEDLAALSFAEILRMDGKYQLDALRNSPKIIAFFEKVKSNYQPPQNRGKPPVKKRPEAQVDLHLIRNALWRSAVLPGWGHSYLGDGRKGKPLCAMALIGLGSSVYMIFHTAELERDYLNEINMDQIEPRYQKYNRARYWRNGLIAATAVIWIYAQSDLLLHFFNQPAKKITAEISGQQVLLGVHWTL